MIKSMVLLSGGLDSTSLLASLINQQEHEESIVALSIIYGQKHVREIECAKNICVYYDIQHHIVEIPHLFKDSASTLTNPNKPNVAMRYEDTIAPGIISPAYVPFRNGLLLAIAAGQAIIAGADNLYIATHKGDTGVLGGYVYPDCTPEFNFAMGHAIYNGSGDKVHLVAPFQHFSKADVVRAGIVAGAPLHLTWSCYNGLDRPCGVCSTCIERLEAFHTVGAPDPVKYMTRNECIDAGLLDGRKEREGHE